MQAVVHLDCPALRQLHAGSQQIQSFGIRTTSGSQQDRIGIGPHRIACQGIAIDNGSFAGIVLDLLYDGVQANRNTFLFQNCLDGIGDIAVFTGNKLVASSKTVTSDPKLAKIEANSSPI